MDKNFSDNLEALLFQAGTFHSLVSELVRMNKIAEILGNKEPGRVRLNIYADDKEIPMIIENEDVYKPTVIRTAALKKAKEDKARFLNKVLAKHKQLTRLIEELLDSRFILKKVEK